MVSVNKKPKYGQIAYFFPSGVCYWNGEEWMSCDIYEDNGDIFEIVRLEIVPPPEEFELVIQ